MTFGLFQRTPFEDDTALLKERWAQEGATITQYSALFGVNTTMHTVTAGKTLYIASMVIDNQTAGAARIDIDDGSGGSQVVSVQFGAQYERVVIPIKVPFVFSTDMRAIVNGGSYNISWNGWEE